MRILVVAGAPSAGLSQTVRRVAASCDEVIAADSGAVACLQADIVPDLVVGDLDSLDQASRARLAELGVPTAVVSAEKDETDLDVAVDAARKRGATCVTFSGVVGGRLDHTLASIGTLARACDLMPVLAEPDVEGWVLGEAGRTTLRLEDKLGATVSLLSLGGAVVSCSGFRYPLQEEHLAALSSRGISNVCVDSPAEIRVHAGTLLVLLIPEHD